MYRVFLEDHHAPKIVVIPLPKHFWKSLPRAFGTSKTPPKTKNVGF